MKRKADDKTGALLSETRSEQNDASEEEREEQSQALIEPDPLLEEVGEANEKAGPLSEPRRVIPSKPC